MTRCRFVSAAGNGFALVDGFEEELPADPARLARALRDPTAWEGAGPPWPPDGLLLLRPPAPRVRGTDGDATRLHATSPTEAEVAAFHADGGMEIYNVDGGRPEACGNGLRCVARRLAERGHARIETARIETVRLATDAGPRVVEVERCGTEVVATAAMGVPEIVLERVTLELPAPAGAGAIRLEGLAVSLGNPHCVVLVADERALPLAAWGALLQRDPRFPHGVNLELVSLREPERLSVRVFERGVGETGSCGTGACAAALAAELRGLRALPARVRMRGGELGVGRAADGQLTLAGPVLDEGAGRLRAGASPARASAAPRPA